MKNTICLLTCFFLCLLSKADELCNKTRREYLDRNFKKYEHIYKIAKDTFEYNMSDIKNPLQFEYEKDIYQLDSCMFFNSDTSVLYSAILQKSIYKEATFDDFTPFRGYRFGNKWYFLDTNEPNLVSHDLGLETLDSLYFPNSFKELSESAFCHATGVRYILGKRGKPLRDKEGNFIPNHQTIEDPAPIGGWPKEFEEHYAKRAREGYSSSHRSDEHRRKFNEEITNSKRPLKIAPKTVLAFRWGQMNKLWYDKYPWYYRWTHRSKKRHIIDSLYKATEKYMPTEEEIWKHDHWQERSVYP